MVITYIEHACILIEHNDVSVVIDPFCNDVDKAVRTNPKFMHPDFIALTHGHDDHTAALSSIAGRNTKIISIVELSTHLASLGYENVFGMNFGGMLDFGDVSFALVPAKHSSSDKGVYLGEAGGFIVKIGDQTVYHAGDTDIFGDMALIEKFHHPNIGLIPIGGRFTMDVDKASVAVNEYFNFDLVIPIHYNTFPPIYANPEVFKNSVSCKTVILTPMESVCCL